MNEAELQVTLLAMLPVLKIELNNAPDKCKYQIGTLAGILLIKTNQIMIRVGGGFSTLEAYIKQVGSFECIKIYKLMKGDAAKGTSPMSFKEAVVFYMTKLKAADKIIKQYMNTDDDEQLSLFENAIEWLKAKQDA